MISFGIVCATVLIAVWCAAFLYRSSTGMLVSHVVDRVYIAAALIENKKIKSKGSDYTMKNHFLI
jgi:hypothetical protein